MEFDLTDRIAITADLSDKVNANTPLHSPKPAASFWIYMLFDLYQLLILSRILLLRYCRLSEHIDLPVWTISLCKRNS
jgi:hypothetical protein